MLDTTGECEGNGAPEICRTVQAIFRDPEGSLEVARNSQGIVNIYCVTL